jgi:hypothetical protein
LSKYVQSKLIRSFLFLIYFSLECGNVFCSTCANYYKLIPSLNLTRPVRVCRDCASTIDDNNTNIEPSPPPSLSSTKSAAPMPIQNGCRQPNGTPNGSFNSAGGQKVKG